MFSSIVRNVAKFAKSQIVLNNHGILAATQIHTNAILNFDRSDGPKRWPEHNKKVFPPQLPDEPPRPAVSFRYYNTIDSIRYISK